MGGRLSEEGWVGLGWVMSLGGDGGGGLVGAD